MKYFLLAALIPLTLFVNAQQDNKKLKNTEKYANFSWNKKLRIAKLKIADGSYYNAAQYLEDVFKEKPDKIEVPHLLGEVNRILRDYESAEKYYKLVVTKDPKAYETDLYFLAQMQKMNGKYEDAKKSFNAYIKSDIGKDNLKGLARVEIQGCDTAIELLKSPTKIKVEHTKGAVNSTIQDFSPKPLKNGNIIFTSQKTDTAVDISTSHANSYTSIFRAERVGDGYPSRSVYPIPPNDSTTNCANAILSGDERTMIFTKCSFGMNNQMKCKLFRSAKKGTDWSTPEELKSLNSEEATTTTEPSFGVDAESNDILYFASDKKGGKGGMDLYYAKMNSDGTFGPAINVGDPINTAGDEMTPYCDTKNKILYFSSNGHPSIGGLDVFKTYGTPGKFGAVMNAGIPINSSADDLYFYLDDRGAKGFMVSNRPGTISPRGATCCDDIWSVNVEREITLKGIYVKRGDASNTPITGVDASMYKTNGSNFEFVQNAITTTTPFMMTVKRGTTYKFNGTKDGFWPSIDNVTVSEDETRDTIEKIFYLDPIIKIHLKVPNVYFAFDKSNVIDFYKYEIDSVVNILNAHPAYSVEVQGHTDSKGSDEYNDKLSQRRTMEVKDFLIKKKNIPETRIVAKWFGEKMPAQANELPNGEDDPEGRARNRRVEFKIITDKPDDNPEFEQYGTVVDAVKTGPGFRPGEKKKEMKEAPKKEEGTAGTPKPMKESPKKEKKEAVNKDNTPTTKKAEKK